MFYCLVEVKIDREKECQTLVAFHFGAESGKIVVGNFLKEENSYILLMDSHYKVKYEKFLFNPKGSIMYRNEPIYSNNNGLVLADRTMGIIGIDSVIYGMLPYIMYRLYDAFHPHGVVELKGFDLIGSPYLLYIGGRYYLEYVSGGVLHYDLLPDLQGELKLGYVHSKQKPVLNYLKEYRVKEFMIPDFSYKFFGRGGVIAEVGVCSGNWYATVKGKTYAVDYEDGVATCSEELPAKYLRFVENYVSYVKENSIEWKRL